MTLLITSMARVLRASHATVVVVVLRSLIGAFVLGSLLGCSPAETGRTPVVIFAAASATDALEAVRPQLERELATPVYVNYAGTPTLAKQIINGADAAVFLSANRQWAAELDRRGLVAEQRVWLGNRLVVVVPSTSDLTLAGFEDLATPRVERLALADTASVPAGQYARQALEDARLWDGLQPRVVGGGDVRETLTLVERGEAEAGIVYATDAAQSSRVRVVHEIDPALHEPIEYPLVLLKSAAESANARRCFERLLSTEISAVFAAQGFTVLRQP